MLYSPALCTLLGRLLLSLPFTPNGRKPNAPNANVPARTPRRTNAAVRRRTNTEHRTPRRTPEHPNTEHRTGSRTNRYHSPPRTNAERSPVPEHRTQTADRTNGERTTGERYPTQCSEYSAALRIQDFEATEPSRTSQDEEQTLTGWSVSTISKALNRKE